MYKCFEIRDYSVKLIFLKTYNMEFNAKTTGINRFVKIKQMKAIFEVLT